MCGRYYVDDDTAREIEKLIRQADEKMRKAENIHLRAGDIHPSGVLRTSTNTQKADAGFVKGR